MERNALIIGIINVKGGVGKTTISMNMSHILSIAGYNVLHIDLDPQGSSTEHLGARTITGKPLKRDEILNLNLYKLLSQPVDMEKYIFKTDYPNLHIIPNARAAAKELIEGGFDFYIKELDYQNKYYSFANNLNKIRDKYDYIIIDGHPSVCQMTTVSIIACDYILSPAIPDSYNVHTVDDTYSMIEACNNKFGTDTEYAGFFLNNVDASGTMKDVYNEVRNFYLASANDYFIDNPIRSSQSVFKSNLSQKLWLEQLNPITKAPINPCRDLLRLLDKELDLLGEKKENIIEYGIKEKYFI